MVSKIMCQFVLFVISSGFHCTSQTLAAAAATASDVKICSVRAEIGKANNAGKKERNGRRNVERINIVATELCGNAAAAADGSPGRRRQQPV